MREMTPAERQALNLLRAGALSDMSDTDFADLEREVAMKGLRNLDGWYHSVVRKAVTEVLKHPGHGDQSVHGGGRRKGGAPSSAPASSGGGGSWNAKQSATLIGDTDKALKDVTDTTARIKSQLDLTFTGDSRDRALGHLKQAKSSLDAAKRNIDLAAKMNGSDRGTVQTNMDAAQRHTQRALQSVESAFAAGSLPTKGSKMFASLRDSVAMVGFLVAEGLDGGVL